MAVQRILIEGNECVDLIAVVEGFFAEMRRRNQECPPRITDW